MSLHQTEAFLAAIRRLESGSYNGNYAARGPVVKSGMYAGQRAFGAYQIMPGNWSAWAREAGIPGASIRDPKAQDRVARFKLLNYYRAYGSFEAAAVAWFAGPSRAKTFARGGNLSGINDGNTSVPQYVQTIRRYMQDKNNPYRTAQGGASTARLPKSNYLDTDERAMVARASVLEKIRQLRASKQSRSASGVTQPFSMSSGGSISADRQMAAGAGMSNMSGLAFGSSRQNFDLSEMILMGLSGNHSLYDDDGNPAAAFEAEDQSGQFDDASFLQSVLSRIAEAGAGGPVQSSGDMLGMTGTDLQTAPGATEGYAEDALWEGQGEDPWGVFDGDMDTDASGLNHSLQETGGEASVMAALAPGAENVLPEEELPDLEGLESELRGEGEGGVQAATPIPTSSSSSSSSSGGLGAAAVELARQHLGTPYLWGGTTPRGFDCSGLVQYVYRQLGINLPRVSADQARAGTAVDSIQSAQPGDLLFWRGQSGRPNHIAIYVGGGKMLEAPRTGLNVRIRDVTRTPNTIRRVV